MFMPITQSRRNELKFVFLAVIAFLSFSISARDFFLIGIGLLIFAYLALKKLQKTEDATPLTTSVTYAGFWVRLGSLIVDAGVYSLFLLLMHLLFQENASRPLVNSGFYLGQLIIILYMVKRWGQSPGKMVMGIKIVKTDLTSLGWKEVILRDWTNIFSSIRYFAEYLLIFMGLLSAGLIFTGTVDPSSFSSRFVKIFHDKILTFDSLWLCSEPFVLLTNRKNRALHDYLAGTVVVLVKEKTKISKYSRVFVLLSILVFFLSFYFYRQDQFKIHQIEAQQGTSFSQRVLAMDYYLGWGVKKSYPDAFNWFQKAAAGGDSKAQEYLGIMYENGYYVNADRNEAIKWYSLSWKNGDYKAKKALKRLGIEVD